jgi:hypothetical protein
MHTSVHTANVYRELQGFTGKLFHEKGGNPYTYMQFTGFQVIYRVPSDLQGIPVILVGKTFAVCKQ